MTIVPLTQGKVAMIDDADAERVLQFKWYAAKDGPRWYAFRVRHDDRGRVVRMHAFITGWPKTDHRNGNGLDNQRGNLRQCTNSQNFWNANKRKNCSSSFKGVSWNRSMHKWHARIMVDYTMKHLGLFQFEEDAARAYDAAASVFFGEFARLNFPKEKEELCSDRT